ncbi:hypothetical protein QUB63_06125 [Microcoleus sp. ARI1-B5]|uniref:hypothetical protein n=1 Tax=unclassified Microcoleus TaxID=2642155 RepID=UPI002FD0794A
MLHITINIPVRSLSGSCDKDGASTQVLDVRSPSRDNKHDNFCDKIRGDVDMKRVLKALGQTLSQSILLVCTLALLVLAGLAVAPSQAAYAGQDRSQAPQSAKITDPAESFEDLNPQAAYEDIVNTAQNPAKVEQVYDESLKEYKGEHPQESIVQKAEELIEKVTGNE